MFIQTILSSVMLILVGIFPTLSHPLSMGLVILVLSIILAVTLGSLMLNFWLSYVLILVLLGGLLVIFVYVSLLAPNELFFKKTFIWSVLGGGFLLTVLNLLNSDIWVTQSNSQQSFFCQSEEGLKWASSFFSSDLWGVTVFFVFYLLLTLIVVVNITKHDYSSLRAR